jgi:hypothetical protein
VHTLGCCFDGRDARTLHVVGPRALVDVARVVQVDALARLVTVLESALVLVAKVAVPSLSVNLFSRSRAEV